MPDDTTSQTVDATSTVQQINRTNLDTPVQRPNVQVVESLTADDKAALDTTRAKKDAALTAARLAVSEGENAELRYNNLVLNIALKYHLTDGDSFSPEGVITRKNRS